MESYPEWPNLAAMMFGLARDWSERPMLRGYRSGKWHSITWGAFGRMAAAAARGLRAVGVSAGDRVVIVMGQGHEYLLREFVRLNPFLLNVDPLDYLR